MLATLRHRERMKNDTKKDLPAQLKKVSDFSNM